MATSQATGSSRSRGRSRSVFSRRVAPFVPVALGMMTQVLPSGAPAPRPPAVHAAASHAKPAACAPDLASCPETGCEAAGTDHALANSLKRRQLSEEGVTPTLLTFADLHKLQDEAIQKVGDTAGDLSAEQRNDLHGLPLASSNGQVSEGDLVQVKGFLVGSPHPNTGESVNCKLKGQDNNDFHIPVSDQSQSAFGTPTEAEFSSVVVEMIPQDRPDGWSLAALDAQRDAERVVLVTGQLFYDNLHHPNGDPDHPRAGQPRRFALWEIHPVSSLKVCTRADGACDPAKPDGWVPLEQTKTDEEVDEQ
jgi:hypothetical protein